MDLRPPTSSIKTLILALLTIGSQPSGAWMQTLGMWAQNYNATAVSQSGYDACAVVNGRLFCWGVNQSGENGVGDTSMHLLPRQVGALTTWTAVSTSAEANTCGIAGGILYCWGKDQFGTAGQGNTTPYLTPQPVGALTTWTAISVSNTDVCGIAGGHLYCWGFNSLGEDGFGNSTQVLIPTQVGALTTWTAVTATVATPAASLGESSSAGDGTPTERMDWEISLHSNHRNRSEA